MFKIKFYNLRQIKNFRKKYYKLLFIFLKVKSYEIFPVWKKKPQLWFVRKALLRLRLLIQGLTKALGDKVKVSIRNVVLVDN